MSSLSSPSSSSLSPSPSPSPSPSAPELTFTKFPELPPEIRHQIWRAALPIPGINFFNVHSFPNDHAGANRSTSPPWLYLDLRRLSIDDDDDEVSRYDPSAWQAREALRRVCREARIVCALPESETATITLTRPRRGLYVRAGDYQLRYLSVYAWPAGATREPEPLAKRKISVRADDVLCLSVENCSFNLPLEEALIIDSIENTEDDNAALLGWVFDPQMTPPLPAAIPRPRICFSMVRGDRTTLRAATNALQSIFTYGQGSSAEEMAESLSLLMLDAYKQDITNRLIEVLARRDKVFWDRFGDRYITRLWNSSDLPAKYRLVKVCPENSNIRKRYLQSAVLPSPKRPFSSSA